jgi:uncharacterized protein involved in exopolysaccharide biosynthesis
MEVQARPLGRIFSVSNALRPIHGWEPMNLNEFFEVVWRRKLIVVAVTLLVVGLAVGALRVVTPQYEATSTVALSPAGTTTDDIFIFTALDDVIPVYTEAAGSRSVSDEATTRAGGELGDISVKTV